MAGREQRPTDDVEGHMTFRNLDTKAVDEDQAVGDVQGHGKRNPDDEAVDDTEGHARYWQDAEAVDEDQAADDTQGHGKGRAIG
jgi:hypothetical protein